MVESGVAWNEWANALYRIVGVEAAGNMRDRGNRIVVIDRPRDISWYSAAGLSECENT